ncbi:MAG: BMP family ABC transporter substrate-binding protein, partial [Anaerolineales bacterium]|nr:BMP family ABC transporter substrate-binding protein [Anaerolineales bacterium]
KLDGRSDVYSLGIMLYEMATGRPPFRAETPPAIFVKHLHDPLPPPHIYNPDLPESVERVILKSLAKDPSERFQTAGELAQALNRSLTGEPIDIPGIPIIKRMPSTESAPLPPVKKKRSILPIVLIAGGGLAALAILVVLAIIIFSNKQPEEPVALQASTLTTTAKPTRKPSPAPASPTSAPAIEPTPISPSPIPPTPTSVPKAAVPDTAPTASAIQDPWGEVIVPPDHPIRLAFVGSLSGDIANLGEMQLNAFTMALEEAGNVYGFPLDPGASLVVDGGCSEEEGVNAARQVVQAENIIGVIGHTCSTSCASAIPIYEDVHLVSISGSCTVSDLSEQGMLLFNRTILRDDRNREEYDRQMVESPVFVEFLERFQQRLGGPINDPDTASLIAYTYDAANTLLAGIRQVAVIDPEGNLLIGRQALSQAIRNLRGFAGVSGDIAFDKNGDRLLPKEQANCQPDDLQIGLVLDTTSPANAMYYEAARIGLVRADNEFPVCPHFIESYQATEFESNIAQFARSGLDLIFIAGYMHEATANVAQQFPDVKFTTLDLIIDPPLDNVQMIQFQVDQASFQAGYLAAAWASLQDPDDPQVGFVGGMQIPPVEQFVVGYQSGVSYYNQQNGAAVAIKGDYIGNFDRRPDASNLAIELIDQGVDVIMNVAGQAGEGALTAAKELGKWGIGVDVDQFHTLPGVQDILLTSVVKRMDNAVFITADSFIQGDFHGGEIVQVTLENGGVDLAPFHNFEDQIPDTLKEELLAIRQGIIRGAIDTGW